MHGISIANEILRKVSLEKKRRAARRVREVKVLVGRDLFPHMEELESAWQMIAEDEDIKDTKLTIKVADGSDCILEEIVFD